MEPWALWIIQEEQGDRYRESEGNEEVAALSCDRCNRKVCRCWQLPHLLWSVCLQLLWWQWQGRNHWSEGIDGKSWLYQWRWSWDGHGSGMQWYLADAGHAVTTYHKYDVTDYEAIDPGRWTAILRNTPWMNTIIALNTMWHQFCAGATHLYSMSGFGHCATNIFAGVFRRFAEPDASECPLEFHYNFFQKLGPVIIHWRNRLVLWGTDLELECRISTGIMRC